MVSSSECRHTPHPAGCGHLWARVAAGGQTGALSAPLLAHVCGGHLQPREAHAVLNIALSFLADLTAHLVHLLPKELLLDMVPSFGPVL